MDETLVHQKTRNKYVIAFWGLGMALVGLAFFFTSQSYRFSYDYRVYEMPLIELVAGLFAVGLLFLGLFFVTGTLALRPIANSKAWIAFLFFVGLLLRLIMIFSEPVLEDDWQRYLWDGAVVAAGENPYRFSPQEVIDGKSSAQLEALAKQAPLVMERINHPHLKTIYPVGAEAFFGISHKIAPFSLTGWRLVILVAEIISFSLLMLLLFETSRHWIWVVLYWWNPLVVKELINSAHMEGVLVPFILAGLYLFLQRRMMFASFALCIAASIKIWPALLLPLIWREMLEHKVRLFMAVAISLLIGALIIAPFLLSGFDDQSGLVAYGLKWRTNSALYPFLESIIGLFRDFFGALSINTALLTRMIISLFLIGLVLWLTLFKHGKWERETDVFWPFYLVVVAFFLLSPAQFPWYFVWVAPFLVFFPSVGFSILVAMMAFYYGVFYLHVHGLYDEYRNWLALLVWLPVWPILVFEFFFQQEPVDA